MGLVGVDAVANVAVRVVCLEGGQHQRSCQLRLSQSVIYQHVKHQRLNHQRTRQVGLSQPLINQLSLSPAKSTNDKRQVNQSLGLGQL